MGTSIFSTAVLLVLAAGASAAAPAITYVSDGVRHWEACYVFGEGFQEPKLEFLAWDPKDERSAVEVVTEFMKQPPQASAQPPAEARRLSDRIRVVSDQAAACVYRDGWIKVLWARSAQGLSRPYVTNQPRLFFAEYTTVAPGQVVRLIGRNLLADYWHPATAVVLVPAGGGAPLEAEVGYAEGDSQQHMNYEMDYIARVRIPEDAPEGKYRVYLYVGQAGVYGVAGPLELTVAKPRPVAVQEVEADSFGAKGLDEADDTDALLKAVQAAAAKTPARVRLGQGTYLVSRPIIVPAGVSLVGRGPAHTTLAANPHRPFELKFTYEGPLPGYARDWEPFFRHHRATPILHLTADSTVSDLTILCKQGVSWGILVGRAREPNRQITITRCRIVQPHLTWMSRQTGWQPQGGCVSFIGPTEECEVSHCELEGVGGLGVIGGPTFRCRTIRNRYRPTTSRYGTSGMGWLIGKHCIVEYNRCEESNRGFTCGPWSGPVEHNLIYRNQVVDGGSLHGAGESVLFEGPDVGLENWFGQPKRVGPDFLEVPDPTLKPDVLAGRFVLVLHGRGFGGFRRIRGNTADRILLAEPWVVEPDTRSWITARQFFFENIILNQYGRDTLGGIEFYGGALNNVVERFVGLRTAMGVEIFASDTADPKQRLSFGPTFHTLVRGCRFDDGMGAWLWANRLLERLHPAPLLVGHRIVGCEFNRASSRFQNGILRTTGNAPGWLQPDDPLVASAPASCLYNVFSGCQFRTTAGSRPIRLDPGARGLFLWANALDGQARPKAAEFVEGQAEALVSFDY